MKLVGVVMAKNEADVIEAFVRHNLRFLDRLLIIDHQSSDATANIVMALRTRRRRIHRCGVAIATCRSTPVDAAHSSARLCRCRTADQTRARSRVRRAQPGDRARQLSVERLLDRQLENGGR